MIPANRLDPTIIRLPVLVARPRPMSRSGQDLDLPFMTEERQQDKDDAILA